MSHSARQIANSLRANAQDYHDGKIDDGQLHRKNREQWSQAESVPGLSVAVDRILRGEPSRAAKKKRIKPVGAKRSGTPKPAKPGKAVKPKLSAAEKAAVQRGTADERKAERLEKQAKALRRKGKTLKSETEKAAEKRRAAEKAARETDRQAKAAAKAARDAKRRAERARR